MTAPYPRQRDPHPLSQGWEAAVAVIGSVLLVVGLAALTGLGVAAAVFGHGWVWPHGSTTIGHVIGGLITGHPGTGLNPHQAQLLPGSATVYACVVGCEVAAIAVSVTAGVLAARYRRPGDARGGMASRRDAQQVLGLSTLRGSKQIIRPDLYPDKPSRPR